jgi:transglutaminase-like putative cysteine protease
MTKRSLMSKRTEIETSSIYERDPREAVREGEESERPSAWRQPLLIIGTLFLIMIMILWVVPYYAVTLDPEPTRFPTIDEIVKLDIDLNRTDIRGEMVVTPRDPIIKQVATAVATAGCDENRLCQAKAEYYFVQQNIVYVAETDEYIQTPRELLATKGGDCEDQSLLLASLLQAVGIPTKFVHIPHHVYVKAYLPDAPRAYRDEEGWIPLDPTCQSCDFGKIPKNN